MIELTSFYYKVENDWRSDSKGSEMLQAGGLLKSSLQVQPLSPNRYKLSTRLLTKLIRSVYSLVSCAETREQLSGGK